MRMTLKYNPQRQRGNNVTVPDCQILHHNQSVRTFTDHGANKVSCQLL
jgi:hypothetical protein